MRQGWYPFVRFNSKNEPGINRSDVDYRATKTYDTMEVRLHTLILNLGTKWEW